MQAVESDNKTGKNTGKNTPYGTAGTVKRRTTNVQT
jgi:hypothetical protein